MAATNTLLTISMITLEAARILSNNLVLTRCVNRLYDDQFSIENAAIGQNLNVRLPPRYTVRVGSVVAEQAATETYVPVTFTNPFGIDLAFTTSELTFSIDKMAERFIKPSIVRLANYTDALGFGLMNNVYNVIGTPGTALTNTNARTNVLNVAALLYNNDCPANEMENMHFISNPSFNAVLSDSNASLFNPSREISEIYVKGMQGEFGGFKHYMDQQVGAHVVGTYGGSPLTNGVNQTGSSLITDGWTATTTILNYGDVITIAGVYAVNPQSKAQLQYLQQFVVTAPTVTDGSGNSTIAISPAIITSGPFQNVSGPAADEMVITVVGASTSIGQQALGFHRDAFILANVDLEVFHDGVVKGEYVKEKETDVGIRIISAYDVKTDQLITRSDIMVAWAMLYPQLACRLYTA